MLCITGDWHVSRALHNSHKAQKSIFPSPPVFLGSILPVLFLCWCEYVSSIGGFGSKKSQGIALEGTAWFEGNTELSSCRRSLPGTDWGQFLLKDQAIALQNPQAMRCPLLSNQLWNDSSSTCCRNKAKHCLALDPAQSMNSFYLCSSGVCAADLGMAAGWAGFTPLGQVALCF